MNDTIKQIVETNEGKYVAVEVFKPVAGNSNSFHTDSIESVDDCLDSCTVAHWELMDEEDYGNSILANSCISSDFTEFYGDKKAMVLCVLLEELDADDFTDCCIKLGLQNDGKNVYVNWHDSAQFTVSISEILDEPEADPAQASGELEDDREASAWLTLYEQYLEWFSNL